MKDSQTEIWFKRAVELALAVYRVTNLFPEGEVLIGQIRKAANQIVVKIGLKQIKKALEEIQKILIYFKIAQAQNWVKSINFIVLEKEYQSLAETIKPSLNSGIQKKKDFSSKFKNLDLNLLKNELNDRQKKILKTIPLKKIFKAYELKEIFPNTNIRTLRRDLEGLVKIGYFKKEKKPNREVSYWRIK